MERIELNIFILIVTNSWPLYGFWSLETQLRRTYIKRIAKRSNHRIIQIKIKSNDSIMPFLCIIISKYNQKSHSVKARQKRHSVVKKCRTGKREKENTTRELSTFESNWNFQQFEMAFFPYSFVSIFFSFEFHWMDYIKVSALARLTQYILRRQCLGRAWKKLSIKIKIEFRCRFRVPLKST